MATGNIGFFEIQVNDFQRAQKFYHNVFGWQFSKSGGVPYEFYMIDTIKQGEVGNQEGGMRKRENRSHQRMGCQGMSVILWLNQLTPHWKK